MLSVDDILQPENVSYTDNVWTWAVAHMLHKGEDWQITTITDTAPIEIVFLSKGEPLTDYLISGNTLQDGTPTPEAPVDVVGCGVRTGNLFDYSTITTGYRIQWANGDPYADNTAIMSDYIPVTEGNYALNMSVLIVGYASDKSYVGVYRSEETWEQSSSGIVSTFTVSSSSNVKFIKMLTCAALEPITNTLMLNAGSTPLPYEPYGVKLPLTIGGTEYPIYLGQVPTTRKIRKMVLTGNEGWTITSNSVLRIGLSGQLRPSTPLCTHYLGSNSTAWSNVPDKSVTVSISGYLAILDTTYTAVSDFKSYLAAQYANGTPVMIWYVLATPETGIVNEPLMKIGDYADTVSMAQAGVTIPTIAGTNTLTVDTTVQPSSVSITGNIKEVQGT